MNNQEVTIELTAFDHQLLDQASKDIASTIVRAGGEISGPTPMPTKKNIFTVNRSPHVNKKAREQYELRTSKRIIRVIRPSSQVMDALGKINLSAGVSVEIKLDGVK